MPDVSATRAARNFAELLDAIEHRGERYTIVRRGRAIAQLEPIRTGGGRDVKSMLTRHQIDGEWESDVAAVRNLLFVEERE